MSIDSKMKPAECWEEHDLFGKDLNRQQVVQLIRQIQADARKDLLEFYRQVAYLTFNHDVIALDYASVSPAKLSVPLEKIDKEWWKLEETTS